jgi:hypothetical protein
VPRRALVAAVLAAASLLTGCSDDAGAGSPRLDATLAEHPVSSVSAVLTLDVAGADDVRVEVHGAAGTFDVPVDEGAVEVPVVGMRADSEYEIVVTATGPAGATAERLPWTTGPLPDDLPPLHLETADPARSQPGVTVLNAMYFGAGFGSPPEPGPRRDAGYILAVDDEGHVVWYHRMPLQILDVAPTSRGTFLVTAGETAIHEIDLLGRTVRELAGRIATDGRGTDLSGEPLATADAVHVDVDSAHHEVLELPSGNLLTLSTGLIELDPVDGERLCPDDPARWIIEDVVVELTPGGEVVGEWPLSAALDPVERPGTELCLPQLAIAPPMWFYEVDDVRDWTHANAVELDEEANALHVSLRHLDAIVAIRYQDDDSGPAGELLWELGPEGSLELAPGGEHLSHQHANELIGPGELLIYDNGNRKDPEQSRAVIYRIDPDAGTAEQVWEHRDVTHDGRPLYTPFLGDVDLLPNGNVLITHGGAASSDGVLYARIVEVDRGTGELVWDLTVGDRATLAWTVYRSERYPSLYRLAG